MFIRHLIQRLSKFLSFLQSLHPFRDGHGAGLHLSLPDLCHSMVIPEQCDHPSDSWSAPLMTGGKSAEPF